MIHFAIQQKITQHCKATMLQHIVPEVGKGGEAAIVKTHDSYVQVARYIDNGNVDENGKNLTEEREYRPLEQIKDSYPKYVMTLDRLLQKRSGIHHMNIIKFIREERLF